MSHRVRLAELLMEGHLRQLLIQMTWLRPNSQKSKKPLRQRQNNSWSLQTFWAIIMRKRPKPINSQILFSTFKMRQISTNLGRMRFMMKYKGMNLIKDQSQLRNLLWLTTCRKFSASSLIVWNMTETDSRWQKRIIHSQSRQQFTLIDSSTRTRKKLTN